MDQVELIVSSIHGFRFLTKRKGYEMASIVDWILRSSRTGANWVQSTISYAIVEISPIPTSSESIRMLDLSDVKPGVGTSITPYSAKKLNTKRAPQWHRRIEASDR